MTFTPNRLDFTLKPIRKKGHGYMQIGKKLLILVMLTSINIVTVASNSPISTTTPQKLLLKFAQVGKDLIGINRGIKNELAPLHEPRLDTPNRFSPARILTRSHWEKVKKIDKLEKSFDKEFIDELIQKSDFLIFDSLPEEQLKKELNLFKQKVYEFCLNTEISVKKTEPEKSSKQLLINIEKVIQKIEKEAYDPAKSATIISKIKNKLWGSEFSYETLPSIIKFMTGVIGFISDIKLIKTLLSCVDVPEADNATQEQIVKALQKINDKVTTQHRQSLVSNSIKILIIPFMDLYKQLQKEDYSINKKIEEARRKRKQALFEMSSEKQIDFSSLIGYEKEKHTLTPVVEALANPLKFKRFDVPTPNGVLFTGPPGTGKTMFMHAIAGNANCPYWYLSCGDLMQNNDEKSISYQIDKIFYDAKESAPAILMIDEIDFIGSRRDSSSKSIKKEVVLSKLLTKFNNFKPKNPYRPVVIVLAANYLENIDPALIRAGRIDIHLTLGLPDSNVRKALLKHELQSIVTTDSPFDLNAFLETFVKLCEGRSHAALVTMVKNARAKAANRHTSTPTLDDFKEALSEIPAI